jgi:hypothetical protein
LARPLEEIAALYIGLRYGTLTGKAPLRKMRALIAAMRIPAER